MQSEEQLPPTLRRVLVAGGWSDDELARARRSGALSRVRRGAYVQGALPTAAAVRHHLLVRATVAGLRRDAVVSHESAAVLHGLPTWGLRLARVHVTRQPPASSDVSRTLRCHVARLEDDEVTAVDGIPVTDPVRTALDLARSLPFEPSVVVLDALLATRTDHAAALGARLARMAGTRGSRAAARAVAFADGRSESVGESRSRVLLHRLGLAPSGLQHPVHTADGVLLGRADFVWETERLLGEFDGRVKYGRLLRPGQEPGDAVFEEKRREDAMRAEGWGMVRWTWDEISGSGPLAGRVGRALRLRRRAGA
ncbi:MULTISPECIES: type IV toxin-antitoxin system AbiEi family antitoxin domain-containing protein [unclassified Geodermatophilus]